MMLKKIALFSMLAISAAAHAEGTYVLAPATGGRFTLTLNADQPIDQFSVVYGRDSVEDAYSPPQNYTLQSATSLGFGLYKLTYAYENQYQPTAPTTVKFSGVPYGENGYGSTSLTTFQQVYGLFQDIQINSTDAVLVSDDLPAGYGKVFSNMPSNNHVVNAYYADWSIYGGHNFDIANMPLQDLNMVTYGFGKIEPSTGNAIVLDPFADYGKASASGVTALPYLALEKAVNPSLRLMYSFGGWGTVKTWKDGSAGNNFQYTSGDFSVLFTYYPSKIETLAHNMVSAIARTGFDGVDIDYEWPAPAETQAAVLGAGHKALCAPQETGKSCNTLPLSQAEADGYAELMYDLSQELQALSKQEDGKPLYLSTALLSGVDKMQALHNFTYNGSIAALKGKDDLTIVLDAVNYVNLMAYDMHGAFDAPADEAGGDNITNFQSQMNVGPEDSSQGNVAQYSVTASLAMLKSLSPNNYSKVVLGIPAYSRLVLLDGNQKNPVKDLPQDYIDQGVYLGLAPASEQALSSVDYGEFVGDVWSQDYQGNNTDAAANGSLTQGIRGSASFDYKCIVDSNNCIMQTASAMTPEQLFGAYNGSDYHYNTGTTGPGAYAQTPWAYDATNNVFMSYDNGASAHFKATYVKSQGLAGVMMWEVDGDVPASAADYDQDSIIHNMRTGLDS